MTTAAGRKLTTETQWCLPSTQDGLDDMKGRAEEQDGEEREFKTS